MAVVLTSKKRSIIFNAEDLKLALMDHYRNKRGYDIVCTEFMYGNCDVAAINEKEFIDFEVKISHGDLIRDRKKLKHIEYKRKEIPDWSQSIHLLPNKFYFAVLPELVDSAIALCVEINPDYGVITFNSVGKTLYQRVVRRAKRLHKRPPSISLILIGCKRLSYDNLVLRSNATCNSRGTMRGARE